MKQITDKEYEEWQKQKSNASNGRVLIPGGLKPSVPHTNMNQRKSESTFSNCSRKYEMKKKMLIDTSNRKGMENSLAFLMGVSVPELYQYIKAAADYATEKQWCFNLELFDKAMENFYSDMIEQELPNKMLFFHLSRRIIGSEKETGYNLQELLTSKNNFSEFLMIHGISFRKGTGNGIELFYRDRQVSLENTMSTDVCYLRSRLGYNIGREDFCFNGFAFRDLLMKNKYARQLQKCPEILECIERYLRINGLTKDYSEKSKYYCFKYKFPIERIIFDGKDGLTGEEKQRHLLNQVAYRLYQYSGDSHYRFDHDNPILRLKDNDNASADFLESTEIITFDMIE